MSTLKHKVSAIGWANMAEANVRAVGTGWAVGAGLEATLS